jgi:uncharacterized protein YjiS (DUF1127 family)
MEMTALTLTHALPLRGGMFSTLVVGFEKAMARRRAFVETRRELSWLSDRELADLGIMRCDIDRVARDAAARI